MSASFGGAFRSGDDRTELRGTFRKWVEAGRGSTLADGEVLAEVHRLTAERDRARNTAAALEDEIAAVRTAWAVNPITASHPGVTGLPVQPSGHDVLREIWPDLAEAIEALEFPK